MRRKSLVFLFGHDGPSFFLKVFCEVFFWPVYFWIHSLCFSPEVHHVGIYHLLFQGAAGGFPSVGLVVHHGDEVGSYETPDVFGARATKRLKRMCHWCFLLPASTG